MPRRLLWAALAVGATTLCPPARAEAPPKVRPAMGVSNRNIDDRDVQSLGLQDRAGVVVVRVVPQSPAAAAGLRPNDVIRKLDGDAVASEQGFSKQLASRTPGQTVKLEVWREKQSLEVSLTLAAVGDMYLNACDAGDAPSCSVLAGLYRRGDSVALDVARAAQLYERACSGGFGPSCKELAALYAHGVGVAHDEAKVAEWSRRACQSAAAVDCVEAAVRALYGDGAPRDTAAAVALLAKGCAASDDAACELLERLGAAR